MSCIDCKAATLSLHYMHHSILSNTQSSTVSYKIATVVLIAMVAIALSSLLPMASLRRVSKIGKHLQPNLSRTMHIQGKQTSCSWSASAKLRSHSHPRVRSELRLHHLRSGIKDGSHHRSRGTEKADSDPEGADRFWRDQFDLHHQHPSSSGSCWWE